MATQSTRNELLESLRLDQRRRWAQGDAVRAEHYLEEHNLLDADIDGALELVYQEVVLREEAGQRPQLEEYTRRFPQLASRLLPLFEVHQAIEASGKPDPYATLAPDAVSHSDPHSPDKTHQLAVPGPPNSDDPYATVLTDATTSSGTAGAGSGVRLGSDAIAGYEILQLLGEGGMGVVFKARHRALQRVVALKMIRPDVYAGAEERARFLTEAKAIARLQHPHIVQIYEVGEQDGRPYFAMEFVDGSSLDRRLNGTPMPPREAARLVLLIARAIEAAHQAGIIHRDLKPANILILDPARPEKEATLRPNVVDASAQSQVSRLWRKMGLGRQTTLKFRRRQTLHGKQTMIPGSGLIPKITDFGLAKQIDQDTGQTRAGTIMGTPSYMPPEQATGDSKAMGPLVDVYAVGAILYETLTGRPPFRGASVLETLDMVRKQEPVPPCRLQPNLPRDLETISLKCLEKDPKRRYESARELADDLERYLNGEPIVARPVAAWERGLKWARRRPAAASLIGLSVVAIVALMLFGWLWAVRESRHATESLQQAERVQASFREALQAVDDLLREVGEVDLADEPHMEQVRERLLAKAQAYFTKFLQEHGDDPVVRHEAARAHSRLGDIHHLLGKHQESEHAYLKALPYLEQLALESPGEPAPRRELARARHGMGIVLKKVNRFAESETAFREALRLRENLASESQNPLDRRDLAFSQYWLGALLAPLSGRRQEAETYYRATLALQEPLAKDFPDQPGFRRELASTLNNLGNLLRASGNPATEATYRRALEIQEELVRTDSTKAEYKRDLARTQGNLGQWYASARRDKPALEAIEAAHSLFAELARDFPKVPDYQLELSMALTELARQWRTTKPREAEDAMRRALSIRQKLVEEFPRVPLYKLRLGQHYSTMGYYYEQTSRPLEAIGSYRLALEVQEQLVQAFPAVSEYHNALGLTRYNLALMRLRQSEFSERGRQAALWSAGLPSHPLGLALITADARAALAEAYAHSSAAAAELGTAVETNPQNALFCRQLSDSLRLQCETALRLGRHVDAADVADKLAHVPQSSADDELRAVRFLARSMTLAASDIGLRPARRKELTDSYGDRAMAVLRAALAKLNTGSRYMRDQVDSLKHHPSYEPLRGREDFRKLLDQAEDRAGTGIGKAHWPAVLKTPACLDDGLIVERPRAGDRRHDA
jgi:serine/threonine protein kinase/tetratricopeptide (TPR) repeat protein